MLKTFATAVALVMGLWSSAWAFECPLLVKQLNDAVATMKADDPKVKQAKDLIAEAGKLHAAGKHADSIATAEKAAKVLGVHLTMKQLPAAQEEQVKAAEQRIMK
ncbi:MAG TPA: hypothetical protein VJX92_09990 [Methylomirabilota bacterium]|nr:hypothetical protein [Methylomirabilota bacterium]